VLIGLETLLLLVQHRLVRGPCAQTVADLRIEKAISGGCEIGVVGRKVHGFLGCLGLWVGECHGNGGVLLLVLYDMLVSFPELVDAV
jgi:hypothetical protein